jgi:hypothetical protein
LFEFSDELLEQISPAIELGRSFVRAKYQKEYAPLMMLWKGIATFVARNPHYRNLIGPVTISNNYHSFTRQLLIEFLKINTPADDDLRKLVTPRNPPASSHARTWPAKLAATIVRSLDGIDELVGEIESDRCGMPVLLRQYLKLNAKLLAFNVDPEWVKTRTTIQVNVQVFKLAQDGANVTCSAIADLLELPSKQRFTIAIASPRETYSSGSRGRLLTSSVRSAICCDDFSIAAQNPQASPKPCAAKNAVAARTP